MKQLTYSGMATARLRANKRIYRSLAVGIFLSVFLVSTLVLTIYGIYEAARQKRYDKVGNVDIVILENGLLTDESVMALGDYDRLGHAYLTARVSERNIYLGYYDDMGTKLLDIHAIEGRMPAQPGELAVEASALEVLEVDWSLGQTVELAVTPVDGLPETRTFTIVGILPERSVYLEAEQTHAGQFPAMVTCQEEPAFDTGSVSYRFLLGLKKGHKVNDSLSDFSKKYWDTGLAEYIYGFDTAGDQSSPWLGYSEERDLKELVTMGSILAGALLLGCGVGISCAMEGILAKRQEEIGVLRALGATKRQIRKMFGRENLILGSILSPLSIAASCPAVWGLSMLFPEKIKFAVSLWLLMPIGIFGFLVILLSGYLPLVRASKLMPMGVIRDVRMLRRSKGLKYQRIFQASKLIASRQARFYPAQHMSAISLVTLTLLCCCLLGSTLLSSLDLPVMEYPGFEINCNVGLYTDYVGVYPNESMTTQSLRQVASLENVKSIRIHREMPVLVQVDTIPGYAVNLEYHDKQIGMLDEADLYLANGGYSRQEWENQREIYLQIQKDHGLQDYMFQTVIYTVDQKKLNTLKPYLTEGGIDVDALNSGTQVLVYAPDIWIKPYESGGYTTITSESVLQKYPDEEYTLTAWNDCFFAGQTLPITQLYSTEQDGAVYQENASVRVGGVIKELDGIFGNNHAIVTTEEGLEKLGLRMEGLISVEVFPDGELTIAQEETLEQRLTAIARRTEGTTVFNVMERLRQNAQEDQQTLFLMVSVMTVFFAVAVGMVVSSVTRQLQSQGKTIGMLRAVGADERTILRCYSGQVNAAVLGGLGISIGILFAVLGIASMGPNASWSWELGIGIVLLCAAMALLGGIYWLLCRMILRLRVREIVNKSIIDNIREL